MEGGEIEMLANENCHIFLYFGVILELLFDISYAFELCLIYIHLSKVLRKKKVQFNQDFLVYTFYV